MSDALTGSAGELRSALAATALPSPAPAKTFAARVTITNFASRLLPAPPGTLAVRGLAGATAIEQEGVLAPSADATGTTYFVTAPLEAALPTGGRQLPSSDPRLAPYLALPAQPAVVNQLAHQAVGTAATPAAKAQALVNWFRSGRFRYTLSPPPTSGSDPLVQFLTVTKAGFCEQFAGAYGMLARSLGIPTRLVVGFTAGQVGSGGTTTVTGADAHVWPQVYLGPGAGWVSVEPTPPAGTGTPGAEGVVGPAVSTGSSSTSPSTVVGGTPTPTPTSTPGAGTVASHGARPKSRPQPTRTARLGMVGGAGRDRRAAPRRPGHLGRLATSTSRPGGGLPPDERVVRAWDRAVLALRRQGLSYRPGETPAEFALRVRLAEQSTEEKAKADAVADLAGLVELACYTPRPCTSTQATHAHALASTIVAAKRSHRRRGRRQETPA